MSPTVDAFRPLRFLFLVSKRRVPESRASSLTGPRAEDGGPPQRRKTLVRGPVAPEAAGNGWDERLTNEAKRGEECSRHNRLILLMFEGKLGLVRDLTRWETKPHGRQDEGRRTGLVRRGSWERPPRARLGRMPAGPSRKAASKNPDWQRAL